MPRNTPRHIPSHLRGDAGPDTLAALVADGRRMGRFWPSAVAQPAAAPQAGAGAREPRREPGFRVTADSAALLGAWLDREG
ncbi:hypothetical protein GXP74_09910 [Streptacidiphilus sp. P02-A3a]|nr:hypothetical protein GXP74_09910 [Streptacidiphilus sp. P02-A3a]